MTPAFYTRTKEQGFTLVEVLISLIIFSIAITGVITVAAQGGLSVNVAKDKLTATYLADEGIELMRAMRDTSVVAAGSGNETAGWDAFVTSISSGSTYCTTASPCDIDVTSASGTSFPVFPTNITSCVVTLCPIYYDSVTGYYTDHAIAGETTVTKFKRGLTIQPIAGTTDELQVTSTVTWVEGVSTQVVSQKEELFNWY